MSRSIQSAVKWSALPTLAGLLFAVSGCAAPNHVLAEREAMPAVDERAAAILAENALSESNGIRLAAGDRFGWQLARSHARYVQAKAREAEEQRMLTGAQPD